MFTQDTCCPPVHRPAGPWKDPPGFGSWPRVELTTPCLSCGSIVKLQTFDFFSRAEEFDFPSHEQSNLYGCCVHNHIMNFDLTVRISCSSFASLLKVCKIKLYLCSTFHTLSVQLKVLHRKKKSTNATCNKKTPPHTHT